MERHGRSLAADLAGIGLDLDTLLSGEPRLLLCGELLAGLHHDLGGRLGPEAAAAALLQFGFLNGLLDGLRVVRSGFAPLEPSALGPAAAARLPMRLAPPRGAGEWSGGWPEALEARALATEAEPCPAPTCHVSAGYTSGWLSGLLDREILALEQSCRAAGHAECGFVAREAQAWRASGDPRAARALDALAFPILRQLAAVHLSEPEAPDASERFEPGSAVIHVWGPVMVMPFAGSDECLRSLELLARDPGARGVRVVIVDLSGAVIDEGFGAASLELVLDAIEGSGAEPLLTGISPLSEPAVADLERTHLVIRKDLPEAIASAFQIAEAQRRTA